MSLIAYVNGSFLPLEKAYVHIEDRGLQFADGVYEVIACYNGHFLALDTHLDRLERSCAAIHLRLPETRDRLTSLIRETYAQNLLDDAMLYVQVTRGVAPRAHVPVGNISPSLIITARPLPGPDDEKLLYGIAAITLKDIRWQRCDIKSIALLASVMGKQEAISHGAYEAFWTDEQGHLFEGSSTNVLAVIDDILVTHPLDHHVLGGITRDIVLRIAAANGIGVRERLWKLDERGLSECMISSTTNAVLPVVRIDGTPVGPGAPGPVTQRLRRLVLAEIAALTAA